MGGARAIDIFTAWREYVEESRLLCVEQALTASVWS